MTTKMMIEMTIDDFEKFREEVLGVLECIYEENLIYKPHGRVKYLVETFPNMKRQVLIDILKFAVNGEFDEDPERVKGAKRHDEEEPEMGHFIEILYEYR